MKLGFQTIDEAIEADRLEILALQMRVAKSRLEEGSVGDERKQQAEESRDADYQMSVSVGS